MGPDRLPFYVEENLIILFEMTLSDLMFFSGSFGAFPGFLDGLLATGVPPKRICRIEIGGRVNRPPETAAQENRCGY
jgi:hypothetical protein